MIRGNKNLGWWARVTTEVRLIDKRALYGGGAALVILAAAGAAANAFGTPVAGAPSAVASMAFADLGLVLLAIALLVPDEHATPADEPTPTPADVSASTDRAQVDTQAVPGRRKASRRGSAKLRPADEKRYRELAVFAGRGPIPPSAVEALWGPKETSPGEIERLLKEFADRSLVERGDGGRLVVGDQSGATDPASGAGAKALAAAHGRLVDGYKSRLPATSWWKGPDDGYFFENIAYHMAQAKRPQDLNRLLLDYDWLRTKLAVGGIIGLLADFAQQPMPADVAAVDEALVLSASDLAARPGRLASILTGRLVGHSNAAVDRLLGQIRDNAPRPWICPLPTAPASTIGSAERSPAGHEGIVRAVAVTPDGRRLVSGGDDHTIRIWNLASGKLERTLEGHTDSVRAVAITPDGRRIVSGGTFDAVRVWDLASGKFVHTIVGQAGYRAVYSVAVSPDGRRVIWGGAGAAVQVWDLASGRIERTLKSQDSTVRAVAISPDGNSALSGGDGGKVQVWDLASGRLVQALNGCANPVCAIAATPDGSRIVAGGHDSTVQVWSMASGRLEQTLWGHTGSVDAVAVTGDGKRIVSHGRDGKVRIWDLASGHEVVSWAPVSGPKSEVMAFCALPTDPSKFAYGDSAGNVRLLRLFEA